jgi:hypothetical protein
MKNRRLQWSLLTLKTLIRPWVALIGGEHLKLRIKRDKKNIPYFELVKPVEKKEPAVWLWVLLVPALLILLYRVFVLPFYVDVVLKNASKIADDDSGTNLYKKALSVSIGESYIEELFTTDVPSEDDSSIVSDTPRATEDNNPDPQVSQRGRLRHKEHVRLEDQSSGEDDVSPKRTLLRQKAASTDLNSLMGSRTTGSSKRAYSAPVRTSDNQNQQVINNTLHRPRRQRTRSLNFAQDKMAERKIAMLEQWREQNVNLEMADLYKKCDKSYLEKNNKLFHFESIEGKVLVRDAQTNDILGVVSGIKTSDSEELFPFTEGVSDAEHWRRLLSTHPDLIGNFSVKSAHVLGVHYSTSGKKTLIFRDISRCPSTKRLYSDSDSDNDSSCSENDDCLTTSKKFKA